MFYVALETMPIKYFSDLARWFCGLYIFIYLHSHMGLWDVGSPGAFQESTLLPENGTVSQFSVFCFVVRGCSMELLFLRGNRCQAKCLCGLRRSFHLLLLILHTYTHMTTLVRAVWILQQLAMCLPICLVWGRHSYKNTALTMCFGVFLWVFEQGARCPVRPPKITPCSIIYASVFCALECFSLHIPNRETTVKEVLDFPCPRLTLYPHYLEAF